MNNFCVICISLISAAGLMPRIVLYFIVGICCSVVPLRFTGPDSWQCLLSWMLPCWSSAAVKSAMLLSLPCCFCNLYSLLCEIYVWDIF